MRPTIALLPDGAVEIGVPGAGAGVRDREDQSVLAGHKRVCGETPIVSL